MDKSWINLERVDPRYFEGIDKFIAFVASNKVELYHTCPCRKCKNYGGSIFTLGEVRGHLLMYGMLESYKNWKHHGESRIGPSFGELHQRYIMDRRGSTSSQIGGGDTYPTMEILDDAFPFRDEHPMIVDDMTNEHTYDTSMAIDDYNKYNQLFIDAQTPVYKGCSKTLLETVLKAMKTKVKNRWSDSSFDDMLSMTKELLPSEDNVYPETYRDVKFILKNLGLGYETIHACEYGCVLFYKEHKDLECCPVCNETRYVCSDGKSRTPRRVVRYFPITPRLRRLYMSPHTAKEMRWHGERVAHDDDFRHPADGDAWKKFDTDFPEFAMDIRNVRLGLATDGFNPFGISGISRSTWPIVVMPYNLPPSMCMKKEFNILCLLISGPKSPSKCLSVFMEPLIDELKMLWDTGVHTYDRHDRSTFQLKAAVLWTISDFPGLGMLAGKKSKGYKACPMCLNETDAKHLACRMAYQGHRRWLDMGHPWRMDAQKFNGQVEYRLAPPSLSGREILSEIRRHQYPTLTLHPLLKSTTSTSCSWTHKTVFYRLPYWKTLSQPYSLDVMHIEKNVFDNIIGTILGLEGKTKDDTRAREGLQQQGVREGLWLDNQEGSSSRRGKVSKAPYTVSTEAKVEILELMQDSRYPHGYAGSLKSKINVADKKFIGLKTHDCHIMLQRLLPIVIRPYLPFHVVDPLILLSKWFRQLCCRELKKDDILKMKDDIVMILCKLEKVFPPAFFTIMVHLMVHLPDQLLLKGPVHYSWMYPIERQLGEYKKYVRNTRYPEGCIAEQYIANECVNFCSLYMNDSSRAPTSEIKFNLSVVSYLVKPFNYLDKERLSDGDLDVAHWCVMQHCEEAKYFIEKHKTQFYKDHPHIDDDDERIDNFQTYFRRWMHELGEENSPWYSKELHLLARHPQISNSYSSCYVNGIKFVIWERDRRLLTQNSGVMVQAGDCYYYGILEKVIELKYAEGMPVVLFKCKWFNTGPTSEGGGIKIDRYGTISIDTSTTWYEDVPYCLASTAIQVFYVDDPKNGEYWKVVNVVSQRGIYNEDSLSRNVMVEEAYQEATPSNIENHVPQNAIHVDLGPPPNSPPRYHTYDDLYLQGEFEEEDEDEDEDEDNIDIEQDDGNQEASYNGDDGFDE